MPADQPATPHPAARRAGWQPNFHTDPHDASLEGRRLFAELLGTFLLTFVAAGGDVIGAATGQSLGQPAKVVAPGLLVMAMIYTLGDVSGAHLNPGVTLAFTLRGDFPWKRVPGYVIAQFLGAILASVLLRLLFGNVGHLGATRPNPALGPLPALVMEIVLTTLLVTVILGTAHNARLTGHNAALAVGGTIALAGLFASPISGASMNSARSLGPALVGGDLSTIWIYFVGPLAGALLAAGIAWILHGPTTPDAIRAASGDSD
ncbi:MAG TPA: aquaporin [Ktedonobacterales bacterium]|jgi:aquaporin Z|nr:aquaporin [Ktedonobacterales bacterium]